MIATSKALDRYYALGLPYEVAHNLRNQVISWARSCGDEWTVNRLKDLKTMYIHKLSGTSWQPDTGSWFAVDKEGNPKGPFGWLFRQKVSRRVFSALLAYTGFIANKPTVRQKEKFLTSVKAEPLVRLPHIPHLKLAVEEVVVHLPQRRVPTFESFGWSDTRRAPQADMTTCPETPDVLFEDMTSTLVWDLLDDDDTQSVLSETLGRFYPMLFQKCEEEVSSPYGNCAGRISTIQEPGFKLRAIANPRRIFQVGLRPLGMQIFELLRHIPWDCTYDQHSGVEAVQTALKRGKVVHCIDLSDATNNFPLDLQLRILHWMVGVSKADLKLFEKVARAPWFVPTSMCDAGSSNSNTDSTSEVDGEEPSHQQIRWTKGQPLGLYPSFPSFALAHGLLLRSFEIEVEKHDTFRVLGDDVVIFDDEVRDLYLKYLRLLQIPISESKTISSDKVAEFGGMVITEGSILKSWKWRLPRDENRLSLAMSLPRTMELTRPEEYISFMVRNCPFPLGTGENPEGVPLQDRVRLSLPIYLDWMRRLDTLRLRRHSIDDLWRLTRDYLEGSWQITSGERERLDEQINLILDKWESVNPSSPLGDVRVEVETSNVLARLWDRLGIREGVYPVDKLPQNLDWRDSYRVATAIQSAIRSQAESRSVNTGFRFWKNKIVSWQERIAYMSRHTLTQLTHEIISEVLLDELQKRPELSDQH